MLLIELHGVPPPDSVDPIARAIADAIRVEARETDRAVRYGARSFRMLLPETGERAARAVADRLGHSSAKMTLDVYAHALEPQRDEATAVLEGALFGSR